LKYRITCRSLYTTNELPSNFHSLPFCGACCSDNHPHQPACETRHSRPILLKSPVMPKHDFNSSPVILPYRIIAMPPTQVLKSTAATRASHIRVRLRIIPVLAISYTCSTYQSPPRNYPDLVTRITSVFVADNLWSTSNSCDPMSCVNPPRNTHNPSEEDNSVIMDLELYLMITYTVTSFM
jgi:hypothetical protein